MGRYRLPSYQPDGCMLNLDWPEHVECELLDNNNIRISGHPDTVQHFHNYFTGKGYEEKAHSPLQRGVSMIQDDKSFHIDMKEARKSIYEQKIGVLFFDLLLDGVENAAHGAMIHKTIR